MKAAAVGTIMPWTGDFGSIPKGWLPCSGQTVNANDYPLLSQVIGTNYGISLSFGGTFPDYTGTIYLPNLNDKHLANIDADYFVAGQTVDNTFTDNAEALAVVQNYIGVNESEGSLPNLVSDAYTDVVLNYTPENDFVGSLTGATVINGEAERLIHIAPRKLGRRHILGHNHSGRIPTISGVSNDRPGKGVIPWSNITFEVRDYFYATGPEYNFSANPTPGDFGNGFGGTSFGKILANVQTSDNNNNVIANNVAGPNAHPISNWLGNDSGKSITNAPFTYDGKLDRSEAIPYGFGGSTVIMPERNYDPGGVNSGVADANAAGNKVLYNKSSISFNFNSTDVLGGANQYITPHTHDSFDCVYDPGNLKLPNRTNTNIVQSNIIPDNNAGKSALNLTAFVPQPNLVCLYLIRAY